ncbi:MAG: CBS domain-containing protein [Deltaproteobacteria bacterium]|nr:CBS domain-containing protein [Deltaproteobacteria bacterium]
MRISKLLESKGSKVYTVSPDTTVYDALKIMAEKEIGALVVVENELMVGIFSERDYARKVILKGRNSLATLVREIMTAKVVHVSPKKKIRKVISLMIKKHVRHLPILQDEKLVGIISIEDVLRLA